MKRTIKIPKILKINDIDGHVINVTFNNGESRLIDFEKVLQNIGVDKSSTAGILYDDKEIKKVKLRNNTLSFDNVNQWITLRNGKKEKVAFEIGADVLLKYSLPEKNEFASRLGRILKDARQKAGLTQKELALMSGTSRTHISRIENDKSDIEINTLKKIIEIGLGRTLEINIK